MDNEFFTFPDALTVFDGYSGKKAMASNYRK